GFVTGGGRRLRRDLVRGQTAHTRAGHSDGVGRASWRCFEADPYARAEADSDGCRAWVAGGLRADLYIDRSRADASGAPRLLDSSAAGDKGRSADRAAARVVAASNLFALRERDHNDFKCIGGMTMKHRLVWLLILVALSLNT